MPQYTEWPGNAFDSNGLRWPVMCVACGTQTHLGPVAVRALDLKSLQNSTDTFATWRLPCCARCAPAQARYHTYLPAVVLAMPCVVLFVVMLTDLEDGPSIFAVTVAGAAAVFAHLAMTLFVEPAVRVQLDGRHVRFLFSNAAFALAAKAQNERKV